MRLSKAVVALFSISILLCSGCAAMHFFSYKIAKGAPGFSGKIAAAGLDKPVEIVFDENAVPHASAQTDHDLYFALGYLHARERLFQMEVMRRIALGRMAELFGNHPENGMTVGQDLLALDRWFRVLGLGRAAKKVVADAQGNPGMKIGDAYVAGINAYIKTGPLPVEFKILDARPEPWTVTDAMAVARLNGWMLSTNITEELIRFLLRSELGPERQKEIYPPMDDYGPYIIERSQKDYRKIYPKGFLTEAKETAVASFDAAAWKESAESVLASCAYVRESLAPLSSPAASNEWALGPSRTVSGKPILANDPHLTHLAPGIFYIVHLKAPGMEAYGVTMPGAPAVVLGENRHLGWATTTTFADTEDIYLEKLDPNDPNKYLTPSGPKPFVVINETVREKLPGGKFAEHPLRIRITDHGPILNDADSTRLAKDAPPLSFRSTMDWKSDDLRTMDGLARGKTVQDFVDAFSSWGYPVQSWMAADDAGHIGFYPAGFTPKRKGWDGTLPVPGWTGEYEWDGAIPYSELPQLFDPPSGVIVTANNKVVPPTDYPWPYTFDAMEGYRAARINELLAQKEKWTAEEIKKIQIDTHVKQADRLLPSLVAAVEKASLTDAEKRAFEMLKAWDRKAETDRVGASLFFTTHQKMWEMTLKDDLSPQAYDLVTAHSWIYGFFDRLWAEDPKARVFDRKDTLKVETRDDLLPLAFKEAVAELTSRYGADQSGWTWGRLHQITYQHAFGSEKAVAGTFNFGPFPSPGARETVWASGGPLKKDYSQPATEGPVMRHVLDFGDRGAGGWIVDLGQSGWAGTKYYTNGYPLWSTGQLWPVLYDESEYKKNAIGTLQLMPK